MQRAALIIAHPGHELRVHHWLETARPVVCVFTDGSGSRQEPRLESTTRVLERAGAAPGPVYGFVSDAGFYELVRRQQAEALVRLVRGLADFFEEKNIEMVVADAAEGYNPTHDCCRFLVDAAVELAQRRTGRRLASYDYLLVGRPDECPESLKEGAQWLRLDEAAVERKLDAAKNYPELQAEVNAALERFGRKAFAVECLRPVPPQADMGVWEAQAPYYETYGEQQVAAGHYSEVIRFAGHLRPLIESVRRAVQTP